MPISVFSIEDKRKKYDLLIFRHLSHLRNSKRAKTNRSYWKQQDHKYTPLSCKFLFLLKLLGYETTEVILVSIQGLSEKLKAKGSKLNILQEDQNSASGAIQHLSNELRVETTLVKSEMSAVESRVQNTKKLNTLQDSSIRILEKEARRKNLAIYGLQKSRANISFKEQSEHYLTKIVPQSKIYRMFSDCHKNRIHVLYLFGFQMRIKETMLCITVQFLERNECLCFGQCCNKYSKFLLKYQVLSTHCFFT